MIQSTSSARHRLRSVALVVLAGLLLAPGTVSAHPLGNFTINHYSGLQVEPDRVLVDHVIDFAEIPTFQERQAMDRAGDGDGTVSDAEAVAFRDAACARQAASLELVFNGARLPLAVSGAAVLFPQGQAGAPTLRLVCALTTGISGVGGLTEMSFSDPTYAERLGWREIVVVGNGAAVLGPEATRPLAASPSARLTSYPSDLLAEPLRTTSVAFSLSGGERRGPSFVAPELAAGGPLAVVPSLGAGGCSDATTILPGGSTDFGRQESARSSRPAT